MTTKISTLSKRSGESARKLATHWREPFDELRQCFQAYHSLLDKLLETSSEGLPGVPVSSSRKSDSQTL